MRGRPKILGAVLVIVRPGHGCRQYPRSTQIWPRPWLRAYINSFNMSPKVVVAIR